MIEAPNLSIRDGIRHGFLTREGGVSEGAYGSLNCGFASGDEPARVARNRAIAVERLGMPANSLCTARQVHGIEVLVAHEPHPGPSTHEADALVTDRPGITLGELAADCAPVLIADPGARVIGAAHAGWRSALGGVIEAMVSAMERVGGTRERMSAAIGPCIARPSYEVGPELQELFVRDDPANAALFTPVPASDRLLFDLKAYVTSRLEAAGIRDATTLPHDTVGDEERFFSARRTRGEGGERFGLLLSAIALDV